MLDILAITFPIYALIGIGYAAVRWGPFRREDMRILGAYVVNIAFPVLVFNAIASRELSEVFNLGYMLAYAIGGWATIAVTYLWFTATRTRPTRRAVAVMGSSCPNSGFVGYPVMLLAFPHLAGSVLAMNVLVEIVLLIPISLAMMEATKPHENSSVLRKSLTVSLRVARQPIMIGLILGLIASLINLPIPDAIDRLFSIIASSASAPSLFVIGGSLAGLSLVGNRSFAAQVVVGKLFLHPVAVGAAAALLPFLGLPGLQGELASVVILSAAMPIFGVYTVFAQDIGEDGIASIAQLATTLVAFFTISLLLSAVT